MRKYLAALVFGGSALAATPLCAASATTVPPVVNVSPAVADQPVQLPVPVLRDEAAMLLVGTALIGLAAAVRRAA